MNQILFFDGVCVLCNGFVDFLLRRDVDHHFRFASLQGARAREVLPAELHEGVETVVLWSQGQVLVRSDAVLTVLSQLGGAWWLFRVFWVVPRPLRDLVYRLVAANRYAMFGKRDSCRLPAPEERARFLD
jgi:predicted DCC family thiol-disulfide oxidoreductase YuxK